MRIAFLCLQVAVIACGVLYYSLDLGRADLRVPFDYAVGGDLFAYLPLYKTIDETGWYLENPRLGAPGVMKLYDFPMTETGLMLGMKLLQSCTGDIFLSVNLYYFLTFITSAIASLLVLLKLRVEEQVAVAVSLLFAFLPYHFWRAMFHPHLATYHAIPLVTLLALMLCSSEPIFVRRDESGRMKLAWFRWRASYAIFVCLVVSISGPYYAYFTAFILAVAGLIGMRRKPRLDPLINALAAISLIAFSFGCQVIPNLLYTYREGRNPLVAQRAFAQYDWFGLRMSHLLRPVPGHRIRWLSSLIPPEKYQPSVDLPWLRNLMNEATVCSPLGAIGVMGLLSLIAIGVLRPRVVGNRERTLNHLSQLTYAVLAFALVGGFAEIIALYITMKIRCYNRISIFIAFFSLAAIAVIATRLKSFIRANSPRSRAAWLALVWGVTALGLLDQIPPLLTPDHGRDIARFNSDREFVRRIEESVPEESMIFQLPAISFPEVGPKFRMYDYELFRGYFHSHKLRWTYGAMRGRDVMNLQERLTALPPEEFVNEIQKLGFAGIYLNRLGYEDNGNAMIDALTRKLGTGPVDSRDGELAFFKLPSVQ